MRVAICLSGQPRTWRRCLPFWETMFAQHGDVEFDVFYHFWNFNTENGIDHVVSGSELDEINQLLKPVDFVVEKSTVDPRAMLENRNTATPTNTAAIWASDQFYSIMRAAHLKRQYEIANGFEYDVCVRTRPDILIENQIVDLPLPKKNTLYSTHCNIGIHPRVGTMFFYSDSMTFDRVSSYYRFMPCIRDDMFSANMAVPSEVSLFFYTKMLNIGVYSIQSIDPKLTRTNENI